MKNEDIISYCCRCGVLRFAVAESEIHSLETKSSDLDNHQSLNSLSAFHGPSRCTKFLTSSTFMDSNEEYFGINDLQLTICYLQKNNRQ